MTNNLPDENVLKEALAIVEDVPDTELVANKLRDSPKRRPCGLRFAQTWCCSICSFDLSGDLGAPLSATRLYHNRSDLSCG